MSVFSWGKGFGLKLQVVWLVLGISLHTEVGLGWVEYHPHLYHHNVSAMKRDAIKVAFCHAKDL